jgi:hypothetical protein
MRRGPDDRDGPMREEREDLGPSRADEDKDWGKVRMSRPPLMQVCGV